MCLHGKGKESRNKYKPHLFTLFTLGHTNYQKTRTNGSRHSLQKKKTKTKNKSDEGKKPLHFIPFPPHVRDAIRSFSTFLLTYTFWVYAHKQHKLPFVTLILYLLFLNLSFPLADGAHIEANILTGS
ncbi:hypothetical protein, unlikely [Trypanosoma brucei gambiense DAL972]|uniref:Uncharacterized protein n=1 Tax=Trypanosoma brucei gambiense (strain MHOM/CI/86/DAL972) TaxID=679716 RepID=C9ZP07_TRYB9|nr:hypothetical protein, unlikely [Trypanosoma brucei gambiense DAL972]CBH11135.1 hypothetical protein, unlikely [Trypanosoma brucei gambiense DAL972]|eukprot:XP_011773422.1 hypothetical protein, unlikely [Trypanosoma brucei gambiense DAL972]